MNLFFLLVVFPFILTKATFMDISKKGSFCVYKNMTKGTAHISVEFVAENQNTSTIQVHLDFFFFYFESVFLTA